MKMRLRDWALLTTLAWLLPALPGCRERSTPATHTGRTATSPKRPAAPAPAPVTAQLKPITVKLRFTGLSHLLGTGANQRLIVVTNQSDARHKLLLLAPAAFETQLLPKARDIEIGTQKTPMEYRDFPQGHEIDLAESGWIQPQKPELKFTEKGDENNPSGSKNVECPDSATAPSTSLHWLPKLSTATKNPMNVKADHEKKDPLPKNVLTRLEMTDGILAASIGSNPFRYEFDLNGKIGQNDGDHIQAVANYLEFTFTAHVHPNKPFYVLKGRKFRAKPNDPDQWVELVRIKPISDKVELILANVVEDSYFKPTQPTELMHFSHYYDVIDRPAAKVRKVVSLARCDPSGADSGVECGPTRP